MTYYYPAIIRKKNNQYRVDVIDLAGCYGEGKDKADALEDAREAGVNWLLVESEDGMDFPKQTHLDDSRTNFKRKGKLYLVKIHLLSPYPIFAILFRKIEQDRRGM